LDNKDTVWLKKHAAKEEDQEMSIAEYLKRYRITIVQKFKAKQTQITTITEDFSDQKSQEYDGQIAENYIQFFEIQVSQETDNNIFIVT
jgi:uncharacterized protein Veg